VLVHNSDNKSISNQTGQQNSRQTKILTILTGKELSKHNTLRELKADALLEIFELSKKEIIFVLMPDFWKRFENDTKFARNKECNFHIFFRSSFSSKKKTSEQRTARSFCFLKYTQLKNITFVKVASLLYFFYCCCCCCRMKNRAKLL